MPEVQIARTAEEFSQSLDLVKAKGLDKGFQKRVRELATLAVMHRAGSKGGRRSSRTRTRGVQTLSTRQIDVSSTEIRARLREGKSVRGFVPESVEDFIRARGLYR